MTAVVAESAENLGKYGLTAPADHIHRDRR